MRKYIIKHYWKDGEHATWESDKGVDEELLNYLKKNYYRFVEKRDKIFNYQNYIISFEYRDSTDNFNRPITNITFYVRKKILKSQLITLSIVLIVIIVGIIFFQQMQENSSDNSTNKGKPKEVNTLKGGDLDDSVNDL